MPLLPGDSASGTPHPRPPVLGTGDAPPVTRTPHPAPPLPDLPTPGGGATQEPLAPGMVNELSVRDGTVSGPDAIPIVYGTQIVDGRVIWKQIGTQYKQGLIGLAAGPCEDILTLWADGIAVPYDAGFYPPGGGAPGWWEHLGAFNQAALGPTHWMGYDVAYPGLCYVDYIVPQFRYNGGLWAPDPKPWPGEFRAKVKGRKVYDPRTLTTVWSDNPALCLRDFLLSETYGAGLGSGEIDETSFEDAADYCDAEDLHLNIVILAEGDVMQWAETLALHFGGRLYRADGKIRLWIEDEVVYSGLAFDETNSREWELSETPASDRPSRVVVEFPSEALAYATDQAIEPQDSLAVAREAVYKLDGVTDKDTAQRLARLLYASQTVASLRCRFVADGTAAKLTIGTRFRLSFPGGCSAQDFLVTDVAPQENGEFAITGREYDAAVYNPAAAGSGPPAPGTPPSPFDDPDDLTVVSWGTHWVLGVPSPVETPQNGYRKLLYTLPADQWISDLVIRSKWTGTLTSDLPWASLGDEIVIPLAGNLPPEATGFALYVPTAPSQTKRQAFHPSGEAAVLTENLAKHQITIRVRNVLGKMSTGITTRLPASALATSGSSTDPGSTLETTQEVRLVEAPANGTNYWSLKPAASLSANRALSLPDASPATGDVLVAASGGDLSWEQTPTLWRGAVTVGTGVGAYVNIAERAGSYQSFAVFVDTIGVGVFHVLTAGGNMTSGNWWTVAAQAVGDVLGEAPWCELDIKTDATPTLQIRLRRVRDDGTAYSCNVLILGTGARMTTLAGSGSSATVSGLLQSASAPVGSILPVGLSAAPQGYLLCDGTAVSRSRYTRLFQAIGTTFGTGDGSTTFSLPDLRQRFPLGKAASGTGSTLAETGGAIDHAHSLSSQEVQAGTGQAVAALSSTGTENPPFVALNFAVRY